MTLPNPPEGYIYDENSGLYYTQIIATDENGTESQIVTWFDTQSGEYSQEVYPIDENTTYVEDGQNGYADGHSGDLACEQPNTFGDDELEYLDGYNTVQPYGNRKRLTRGAVIGIIIGSVVAVALIIGTIIFLRNKPEKVSDFSDETVAEEANETLEADTEDTSVDNSDSDTEEEFLYPEETETADWIQLSEERDRYPKASYIEDYEVSIFYIDALNASGVCIYGIGSADNRFLCNPDGYSDGDVLYRWSVALSDKCEVILNGKAMYCGKDRIWEYPSPGFFSAQLVYERDGKEVIEDIEFSMGVDDVMFMNFVIPEGVGVDLSVFGDKGTYKLKVHSKIGPYEYSGVYVPAYSFSIEDTDFYRPSNKPHEEKYLSAHDMTDEEYEMQKLEEAAGEYVVEESAAGSYAKYLDDDYTATPSGSPQSGLPAAGFFRSDDGTVKMDIMDDGLIQYYSADSVKYEGWYTYDTEYSGYTDQGNVYYIHAHFNTPSGEEKMEMYIDTEYWGLFVLSGPGNYGTGELWLG